MSRKRVQLSELNFKNICQLAQHLLQDKLKSLTVFLADNPQFSACYANAGKQNVENVSLRINQTHY